METRFSRTALALALALGLGACQQGQGGLNDETIGTLGGAGAGAILGSQFGGGTGNTVATAAGAVLGALAGRELARYLSEDDQQEALEAERTAVARNQPISWRNPSSGNQGTIEPVRTYRNDQGNLCRDYTHVITVDGRQETASGTACRQEDGTWRLVA